MGINRRNFIAGFGAAAGTIAIAANRTGPPLVFIHGIKGSILTDSHGSIRWFTVWQALGLTSPALSLPLRWQGEVQQRDDLAATAPLASVAWHDVYGPFLDWASASEFSFHSFAYDWRRDNLETIDAFMVFLEKVRRESGGARVRVVSHSMGGLIAFAAINRRPDLFQSALFAGVPFGSSISFLEDLHSGTSNGFNRSILSPQVLFTFASPYALLPFDPMDSGLVEANGDRIAHDWYSAEDWARQKLGIFADAGSNGVSQEQWAHLRKALEHARRFRSEIVCKESVIYPPMAVLASESYPTLLAAKRNGPRSVKGWDFASAPMKPGDSRIDFTKAAPPSGTHYRVFKSSRAHEGLLNDTAQVASILAELSG